MLGIGGPVDPPRVSRAPRSLVIAIPMSCPICNDTGWKPVESDGVRRVERCDCWRAAAVQRQLDLARIPPRYKHCDFEAFEAYNDRLRAALEAAGKLADAFPVERQGLFFHGPPGVGKSHLAVALLRRVILTRGASGLYYDTRELLKIIRSTYNRETQTPELHVLAPVMEVDFLVLDDIGAEKPSEWVDETLNLIVNTRYNQNRTTVFTSNYKDFEAIEDPTSLLSRIGFRMRSRLHEMCVFVEMDGGDYRERPKNHTTKDLLELWETSPKDRSRATVRRPGQLKASLREGRGDLKWSGGRAGSKDR
jgi:DNA replication protein DnaC